MKQSKFDAWLTSQPEDDELEQVLEGRYDDTRGEVACTSCDEIVGWDWDYSFKPYWTDANETIYLCGLCKAEADEAEAKWQAQLI